MTPDGHPTEINEDIKGAKILIVDDNPTNLGVLFNNLTNVGFTVLLVQDGKRALELVQSENPDIILLDIIMPDINGYEVCQELKQNEATREVPVIFMSALSDTVDKVRGFEIGAVDYITKPFQQEEVIARINAHLTIKRQREQLHQLNADKDRFFAIISHELKNQFVNLFILTETLQETIDPARELQHEAILNINSVVDNTHKLLENLLDWASLKRGKLKYEPQILDVREIIYLTFDLLQSRAKDKGISLQTEVEDSVLVYADEKMIQAVMRNLVGNAIKFTNRGGYVKIYADAQPEQINIHVEDDGIGISEIGQSKLFRIDEKFKMNGTDDEPSNGLGLILCKEFVEKMGGQIWLKSEPEKGTTFSFSVPPAPTH